MADQTQGNTFRTNEINRIRNEIVTEIKVREKLYHKYKKAYNTFQTINITSGTLSGLTSVGTVTTLATIVGMPVSLALAGTTALLGLVSMTSGMSNKIVAKKMEKHEKLMSLAIQTLDAINKLLSGAYLDGSISNKEFKEILQEHEKYILLHSTIRHSTRAHITNNKAKFIEDSISQSKPGMKSLLNQQVK